MSTEVPNKFIPSLNGLDRPAKWLLLLLVLIVFVVLLYPSLVIKSPNYFAGDIAEHNVKASQDFFIEDPEATETSRRQAVEQVLTIYDFDPRISQKIAAKVLAAFGEMRAIIANLNTAANIGGADQHQSTDTASSAALKALLDQERERALWAHKEDFENRLGMEVDQGAFKLMIGDGFSANTASLIAKILGDIFSNGVVGNKEVLLKEGDKGITLRDVSRQTEKTVYALRQYYGPDQAKTMVRIVAEPLVRDLNYNLINMIVDVAQRLLQPNITLNRNETEARKHRALLDVKPVMYQIKAGEMLLREGERITSLQLLKLRAQGKKEDIQKLTTAGIGAGCMLAGLILSLHLLIFQQPRLTHLNTKQNMLFMGIMLITVLLVVKLGASFDSEILSMPSSAMIYAIPAAAGAMLVCLFLGFAIALPFSLVASICEAFLTGQGF
jgi:membrane-associated HD superfamily phosphohydrolase